MSERDGKNVSEYQLATKLITSNWFLKHVAKSRPHKRFMVCTRDFKEVRWAATPAKLTTKGAKVAKVKELEKVLSGRQTAVFQTSYGKGADMACFSLVFANRTLDLQCMSETERDIYVHAFNWLLEKEKERQSGVSKPYNVKHVSHVNVNYEWHNSDLKKDFLVGRLLGKGSFGSVCLGFHRGSGMQMAIKMIDMKINGEKPEDIKAEVDVLKKCKHEGIVSFYGCAGPDHCKRLWILMELCRGGSLRDFLDTFGPLPEEKIQYVCAMSLKALNYLHNRKVIHRDLKAANILLTREGQVKITDFGVSFSASTHATLDSKSDESKRVVGSPFWMPPEVIEERGASFQSDVWSLAITFMELAEGVPPHAEMRSVFGILRAILKNPAPKLSHRSRWTEDFHSLLTKMLQKDPKKRPLPRELLGHPFVSSALYRAACGPSPLEEECKNRIRIQRKEKLKNLGSPGEGAFPQQHLAPPPATAKKSAKRPEGKTNGMRTFAANSSTSRGKVVSQGYGTVAQTKRGVDSKDGTVAKMKTGVDSNNSGGFKSVGFKTVAAESGGFQTAGFESASFQTGSFQADRTNMKSVSFSAIQTEEGNEFSEDSDDDYDYGTKSFDLADNKSEGTEITVERVSFQDQSLAEQYERKLKCNTIKLRSLKNSGKQEEKKESASIPALERKKDSALLVYGAGALAVWWFFGFRYLTLASVLYLGFCFT